MEELAFEAERAAQAGDKKIIGEAMIISYNSQNWAMMQTKKYYQMQTSRLHTMTSHTIFQVILILQLSRISTL